MRNAIPVVINVGVILYSIIFSASYAAPAEITIRTGSTPTLVQNWRSLAIKFDAPYPVGSVELSVSLSLEGRLDKIKVVARDLSFNKEISNIFGAYPDNLQLSKATVWSFPADSRDWLLYINIPYGSPVSKESVRCEATSSYREYNMLRVYIDFNMKALKFEFYDHCHNYLEEKVVKF